MVKNRKRLYRISKDAKLGGVCAGFAEYFDIDPTIMRLIWIASLFLSVGTTIIVYLILWLVMDEK